MEEQIRRSMPRETLCRYCEHALDIYETVCKKSRQDKTKINGLIVVVKCTGFDALDKGGE